MPPRLPSHPGCFPARVRFPAIHREMPASSPTALPAKGDCRSGKPDLSLSWLHHSSSELGVSPSELDHSPSELGHSPSTLGDSPSELGHSRSEARSFPIKARSFSICARPLKRLMSNIRPLREVVVRRMEIGQALMAIARLSILTTGPVLHKIAVLMAQSDGGLPYAPFAGKNTIGKTDHCLSSWAVRAAIVAEDGSGGGFSGFGNCCIQPAQRFNS